MCVCKVQIPQIYRYRYRYIDIDIDIDIDRIGLVEFRLVG